MKLELSTSTKLLIFSFFSSHFQILITIHCTIIAECYNSSIYTSGSSFEANLKTMLTSLSINGVLRHDTFYNATYGDDPNRVYGFSQCMSGASEADCRQCLINSTVEIVQQCPGRTQAIFRSFDCILRYSNQRFFSQPDDTVRVTAWPTAIRSNPNLMIKEMEALILDASATPSRYGRRTTNFSKHETTYGLAQCTRDLSEKDCYACLNSMVDAFKYCCHGRSGGNVYSVSCNIRYETYPFYYLYDSPPSLLASSNIPTQGNEGKIALHF
ncbi:cysteine-rich repeat secretory protein 38-like protein [Cinnamomum micranthum f. kanehirae]|uniref:Cysteine-rich repeat secretory protein 38-like protein n=1 Tax=Cinnamomum micranthum f. kanehirae TaxID=337451 RepID=A0A443PC06_9MAGN|nr:cysteine-rich repeat secretory protein 38-like protein [Cinnamomum micranthum f. kanehirae]